MGASVAPVRSVRFLPAPLLLDMGEPHDVGGRRSAPARTPEAPRVAVQSQGIATQEAEVAGLLTGPQGSLGERHPCDLGVPVPATRIRLAKDSEMGEERGADREELLVGELRERSTLDGHDRPPFGWPN